MHARRDIREAIDEGRPIPDGAGAHDVAAVLLAFFACLPRTFMPLAAVHVCEVTVPSVPSPAPAHPLPERRSAGRQPHICRQQHRACTRISRRFCRPRSLSRHDATCAVSHPDTASESGCSAGCPPAERRPDGCQMMITYTNSCDTSIRAGVQAEAAASLLADCLTPVEWAVCRHVLGLFREALQQADGNGLSAAALAALLAGACGDSIRHRSPTRTKGCCGRAHAPV